MRSVPYLSPPKSQVLSVLFQAGSKNRQRSNNNIMKIYNYRSCTGLVLMITCFSFVSQAMSYEMQSGHYARHNVGEPARLIIRRIPNLGNNVIVDLRIDGAPGGSIAYGHTYKTFVPAGRHVLSVLATPTPKWTTPWTMILNAHSGRTYIFTATRGHSGNLVLRGE
jgi:hypothetical protein